MNATEVSGLTASSHDPRRQQRPGKSLVEGLASYILFVIGAATPRRGAGPTLFVTWPGAATRRRPMTTEP